MKKAHISIHLLLFTLLSVLLKAQPTELKLTATPMDISADNKLLLGFISATDLGIWDLTTKKRVAEIGNSNPYEWSGVGKFSPGNRYVFLETERGNYAQFIFELGTNKYSELDKGRNFKGFCNDSTLWYFIPGNNTIGTIRLVKDNEGYLSTRQDWTFTYVKEDPQAGTHSVIWSAEKGCFYVIIRNGSTNQMWVAGTIRPGDNAITPLPGDVNKKIKKFDYIYEAKTALLFRGKKESVVMDINTMEISPANYKKPNAPLYYFNNKYAWHYDNNELICMTMDGSTSQTIKGIGFKDFLPSPDLTILALSRPTGVELYSTTNLAKPNYTLKVTGGNDALLADFVDFAKANVKKLDAFADSILKAKYAADGWELVPGISYITPNDDKNDVKLNIENSYDYAACRIGIDYMYTLQGGKLPDEKYIVKVGFGATSNNYNRYFIKDDYDFYLGNTGIMMFFSQLPVEAEIFSVAENKDPIFNLIPKYSIRYYFLRKSVTTHTTDEAAHNYKDQIIHVQTSSSSSSSTSSYCDSPNLESADLDLLRKMSDSFEKNTDMVASEVHCGVTTKSFFQPDYNGDIYVDVITSSPCNNVILYNVTTNTYEQARATVKPLSEVSPNLSSFQESKSLYMGRIIIQSKANTGAQFNVMVTNPKENSTTKGCSYICVWHN